MDIKKILFKTNDIDVEKSLPDAVIFCNRDGKIEWANDKATEIFETSKIHLLTSNITDFLENAQNLVINAIASDNAVITKFLGKEIYFDMTAKEIKEGFVLAFRDSQLQNIGFSTKNETDKSQNSMNKNAFLLKLSNDFKSPLQSIIGFSQAMTDGLGGTMSEQQEKYIRIIKKNSTELMYLVNKLMELTQTEVEKISPELKIFDIVSLLNMVVRYNEQLCKDKDIKWTINVEEGIKNTIFSDEEMIKKILQNILEIIIKSVDMGVIEISLSTVDEDTIKSKNLFGNNFIKISVSCNSLLLSENDLELLFEPYKIIDSPNKKNLLKSLPLACINNMIQALNGAVWLESKILKNTSFNIVIPMSKD